MESTDSFCWPTLDYTSYTCVHVRGWGWCMWRELCDHAHGEIEGVDKLLLSVCIDDAWFTKLLFFHVWIRTLVSPALKVVLGQYRT